MIERIGELSPISYRAYEKLCDAARWAYQVTSLDWGGKYVGPETPECAGVSVVLTSILLDEKEGWRMEMVWAIYDLGDGRPSIHYYPKIRYPSKSWIVDPTYQQFVPVGKRKQLPGLMVAELNTAENLKEALAIHRIDPKYYPFWLEKNFP